MTLGQNLTFDTRGLRPLSGRTRQQAGSQLDGRFRRDLAIQARLSEGPLHQPIQTLLELVGFENVIE